MMEDNDQQEIRKYIIIYIYIDVSFFFSFWGVVVAAAAAVSQG